MQYREVMGRLREMGTAQNVKIYQRHGAGSKLYGVSTANLKKLQKAIKTDHGLARSLWKSGNMDARVLGLMVADPEQLTLREAESWLADIDYYGLSNYLGGLVARTSFGEKAFRKWSVSRREYFQHCAWDVLGTMLKNGHSFEKDALHGILETIGKRIHQSPNRARSAMNNAVICIGTYGAGMKTAAIRAARQIGPVEVDRGDTSCKTPDAIAAIEKAYAWRMAKQKKARSRA